MTQVLLAGEQVSALVENFPMAVERFGIKNLGHAKTLDAVSRCLGFRNNEHRQALAPSGSYHDGFHSGFLQDVAGQVITKCSAADPEDAAQRLVRRALADQPPGFATVLHAAGLTYLLSVWGFAPVTPVQGQYRSVMDLLMVPVTDWAGVIQMQPESRVGGFRLTSLQMRWGIGQRVLDQLMAVTADATFVADAFRVCEGDRKSDIQALFNRLK